MLLRAGTTLNNRYEILSTVGTGGMADVYRARDTVLKRLVAIKVLKEEFSSDAGFVAKFRREAQAVGALNHPNIVGVFDVGEQNGMYYIVMELVEGINLKKYIEKIGAMDEREAVEVAMQVAKGLEAAHDQGIIHRDIKPQNIIISREGKIKVADFGIARMAATETSTTSTMGSVHYISPEQARGGACDARSDIYSLGITLYEMVTGEVPFDGESSVAVALKHVQEPVRPPRELVPTISQNLEKIILKCTQKNPVWRYATMTDLLVDFKKLIVMPGEDFVVLPQEGANDPHVAMRQEDSDILKVAGISPRKRNWETEEEALQAYEEGVSKAIGLQEDDRRAEEKAKKTESLLNYLMLGIGVLILVTIIAIIFRACSMLTPTRRTTTAWVPDTVATTPRASTTAPPTTPQPTVPTPPTTTLPSTSATAEATGESDIPEGTVRLRDLQGMDYLDAMELLAEDGLRVHLDYEVVPEDSPFENNTVVSQNYEAGVPLLLGTEVTIWIATRDSSTVVIPTNIIGKTAEEAALLLREMGLVVSSGTEWENSSTVEEGRVMGTNPTVGSLADKGTPVTLIISSGPAMFRLPSLLGYTKDQAIAALTAVGLYSSNIQIRPNTVPSSTYLPGTVAAVEASLGGSTRAVSAGESLDLRSVIYLTMTESNPVMPNLLGRSDIDMVVYELQQMGLAVSLPKKASVDYPVGQVCWVTQKDGKTEIPEGTLLERGTIVMVHISALAVPEGILGLTVTEAGEMLEALNIGFKYKDNKAPADPDKLVVTAVDPKEGTVLDEQGIVTISFGDALESTDATQETTSTEATTQAAETSGGPAATGKMPDYAGMTKEGLLAALYALNLNLDIQEVHGKSNDFPTPGMVYFVSFDGNVDSASEIPADAELKEGQTVYIHISDGPVQ